MICDICGLPMAVRIDDRGYRVCDDCDLSAVDREQLTRRTWVDHVFAFIRYTLGAIFDLLTGALFGALAFAVLVLIVWLVR